MDPITYNDEIHNELLQEREEESVPRARSVKIPKKPYKSDVDRLIDDVYHRTVPGLFYAHCHNFIDAMLKGNYQWWVIEDKIKGVLLWAKKKGANHTGIRTTFNKVLVEKGLPPVTKIPHVTGR